MTLVANCRLVLTQQRGNSQIGKALSFQQAQPILVQGLDPILLDFRLFLNQVVYLHQKPRIDSAEFSNFVNRKTVPHGVGDIP